MKHTNVFNSILTHFKHSPVGTCLTIFRSVVLVVLSASFLTACNPGGTTNNYGADKSGMSGGGATKDTGDGTGGATGDGGGGQGILCGEAKDQKLKNRLFVRDIYESVFNYNRQMKSIPNDVAGTDTVSIEAIKILTSSLKVYFGPASENLEFTQDKFWTEFYKKISFLDEEKSLVPSTDANSPIVLPKGCNVVQIAYWDESPGPSENGTLYVNKQFWTKLNQLNKVGLLAHEYFFKQARKAQYKNSDAIRNKVGELLSVQGLSPLFKNWVPSLDKRYSEILPRYVGGYKVCRGTSPDDPSAKLLLYQYKGADEMQNVVIPLLESNTINASFLKNTSFTFDPHVNTELATTTDLMTFQSALSGSELDPLNGTDASSFTRWFDEKDYLNFLLRDGSKGRLASALMNLTTKSESIWSNFLPSSPRLIKFSIINPASGASVLETKNKTREELIYAVQKAISDKLETCSVTWPDNDGWIAVLKKEISDNIAAGTRPKVWVKWTALLRTLEVTTCKIASDSLLTEDLPSLLYSLTLNNLDSKLAMSALEDLEEAKWANIPPARIRFTQDTTTLNFDLQCDDYESAYRKIVTKEYPIKLKTPGNRRATRVYSTYESDELPERIKIRNEALARLVESLNFTSNGEFAGGGDLPGEKCTIYDNFKRFGCEDRGLFENELSRETDVQITGCANEVTTWLPLPNRPNGSPEVCAMIKMKSTNHSFKVYFYSSKVSGLTFTFHRFMGVLKERDIRNGEIIE
jgi:hypothetical protein